MHSAWLRRVCCWSRSACPGISDVFLVNTSAWFTEAPAAPVRISDFGGVRVVDAGRDVQTREGEQVTLQPVISTLVTHTNWQLAGVPLVDADPQLAGFQFAPPDSGDYVLELVGDFLGQEVRDSVTLWVADVAASLEFSEGTATEGSVYLLNLLATDPGQDAIVRWEIDWDGPGSNGVQYTTVATRRIGENLWDIDYDNDGVVDVSIAGNDNGELPSLGHIFADGPSTFTIHVRAVNEEGAVSTATKSVVVRDVAPSLALSLANAPLSEGDLAILVLSDPQDAGFDVVTGTIIEWGDGSIDVLTAAEMPADRRVSHRYQSSGEFTIRVSLIDEDGLHGSIVTGGQRTPGGGGLSVEIANLAPVASFGFTHTSPDGLLREGDVITLHFTGASDPSPRDLEDLRFSYDMDGDGLFTGPLDVVNTRLSSFPLTLRDDGPLSITGRVSDPDGGFTDYTIVLDDGDDADDDADDILNVVPAELSAGGPYLWTRPEPDLGN